MNFKRLAKVMIAGFLGFGSTDMAYTADLSANVKAPPNPFFISYGAKAYSDYVYRGMSYSDGKPSVQAYVDVSAFEYLYAGVVGSLVRYPTENGFSDPPVEIDVYGGFRHSWNDFTLEAGGVYFYYPDQKPGYSNLNSWEIYIKPSYTVGDGVTLSTNYSWTADYFATGADASYLAVSGRWDIPFAPMAALKPYASAEVGRQWVGMTEFGTNTPDYNTWNVGAGFSVGKMTIDLRYHDSDMSKSDCLNVAGDRNWCGSRYVASVAVNF